MASPTLERLAELHLLALRAGNASPRTLGSYAHILGLLRDWLSESLGRPPTLAALTVEHVRRWGVALVGPRRNANTALHYQAVVKAHTSWLHKEGLVRADPLATLRVSSPEFKEPRVLDDDELARLLACCELMLQPLRNKAILLLLAETGSRVSGLCGLDMADVVMPTAKVAEGRIIIRLKGRDEKALLFGRKAAQALQHYVMLERAAPADMGPLFLTREGLRCKPDTLRGALREVARHAGITDKKTSPHGLRHFFGTALAAQGLNAFQIKERLGHKTLATSQLYVHLSQRQQEFKSALDGNDAITLRLLKPPPRRKQRGKREAS